VREHSSSQLTHRERVVTALEHKETDRVPIAMICGGINPPAEKELRAYLSRTRNLTLEEFLNPLLDIKTVDPTYVGPALGDREDIWGVVRKPMSYGPGSYDEIGYYPLAEARSVDDVLKHRWPSPDWFDYSSIPDRVREANSDGDYAIIASGGNIFETAWYMRGFERMFVDILESPELAATILDKVTDFYVERASRMLAAAGGRIDLVFTADDIGGQQGLLMSLSTWEHILKPLHRRLNAAIHEFDTRVIYHTDGSVMEAIPGLIDMGIDVLQALQFDARGMDPNVMKASYGDRLSFEGGISVQSTLPFGTVEDVKKEVAERIAVLGKGGGYILGPSHAVQAGTPPENIAAMFDAATKRL